MASASAAASTLSEPPRRTQESQTRTKALGLPMEKPAASTEPQGPRPVLGRDSVQVPDDQDFRSFRSECEAEAGWNLTYSKAGVSVWVQAVQMDRTLHKIKVGLPCPMCSRTASNRESSGPPAGPQTPGYTSEGVSCQEPGGGTVCSCTIAQMGQLRPGEGCVTPAHLGRTQASACPCLLQGCGLLPGPSRRVESLRDPSAPTTLHLVPDLSYPTWETRPFSV